MHSSSVLIVHPSAERLRLPDMAHGKLTASGNTGHYSIDSPSHGKLTSNTRHYSLDSPSLTSPPGYGLIDNSHNIMIDQKPPIASTHCTMMNMMPAMSIPSTSMPLGSTSNHQFHSFNAPLVMAPTAPPGLLHLGKYLPCVVNLFSCGDC